MVIESIRQVIYISKSTRPIDHGDLEDLVATASRNNKRADITGALLYIENSFIQVLEGEAAAINRLLATIELDSRHENMRLIADRMIDFRNFSEWSMANVVPDIQDASIIKSELVTSSKTGGDSEPILMPLTQTFAMMQRLYKTDRALQRARPQI